MLTGAQNDRANLITRDFFRRQKMGKIKYIICIIAVTLLALNSYSQQISQAEFLSELDQKASATYEDALALFKFQSEAEKSNKADFSLQGYDKNDLLTKGMASLMTARYLDLDGSFLYLIFGTERYAYKACVSNNLFSKNGSENDKMTGLELIELFSRISDIKGDK